jgi:hypothetical protein
LAKAVDEEDILKKHSTIESRCEYTLKRTDIDEKLRVSILRNIIFEYSREGDIDSVEHHINYLIKSKFPIESLNLVGRDHFTLWKLFWDMDPFSNFHIKLKILFESIEGLDEKTTKYLAESGELYDVDAVSSLGEGL